MLFLDTVLFDRDVNIVEPRFPSAAADGNDEITKTGLTQMQ